MDEQVLLQRCRNLAGFPPDAPCDGDALIGVLQQFRPDGLGLAGLFDGLPLGAALQQRLRQLYEIAGAAARPGGGLDAYFIVRNPPPLDPQRAQTAALAWLGSLLALARETQFDDVIDQLQPLPEVRVLEGIPPKQTKDDLRNISLYRVIKQQGASLCERLSRDDAALNLLRPAYYYAACDWALRDYLLWPLYHRFTQLDDPFQDYFELWRHGVKLRAFSNERLDVYLPPRPVSD